MGGMVKGRHTHKLNGEPYPSFMSLFIMESIGRNIGREFNHLDNTVVGSLNSVEAIQKLKSEMNTHSQTSTHCSGLGQPRQTK